MQQMKRWSKRPSTSFFLCFSLLLVTLVGQAHSQPNSGDTVSLTEGVLIDSARSAVFLMNPAGGIDAVELNAGQTLWSTEAAAKPLWISENRLVAQAESEVATNALDIVSVDTTTGEKHLETRVDLPAGVYGGIDDQLGKAFRARAEQVGSELILSWTSKQQLIQGISRPTTQTLGPAVATKSARAVEGALSFDLATGEAQPLRQRKATAAPRSHLLELTTESGIPGASGRQFLSVDGRHILVSNRGTDELGVPNYRWTIYSRESGVFVGEVEREVSVAPFLIAQDQLLIASPPFVRQRGEAWIDEPLKLRSIDLQSGEEAWSRELRDTTYRGPFPP